MRYPITKTFIIEYFKTHHIEPKVIIEIGAGDCTDSTQFSDIWPDCKIYAFEIVPELVNISKENIKDYPNIKLIETVISDCDGEIDFYQTGNFCSSSIILKHIQSHHPKTVLRKSMKLDSCEDIKDIKTVDLLWLCVQGADDIVLKGATQTLQKTTLIINQGASYSTRVIPGFMPCVHNMIIEQRQAFIKKENI